MIYTVTFNPSIDYVIQVDNFSLGNVNRVKADYKYPGGKGINVSRVLNNIGVKSKALGFIGGFTGDFIKEFLKIEGVETDFISVEGETRINVKLKSYEETEINGAGPDIKEEDLNTLLEKIEKITSNDFVVLSGNIQKNLPREIYTVIQKKCLKNNVRVIVDTTGKALISTLEYKPFLIKPNKSELSEIFNNEINNKEDIICYAEKLIKKGAQNVITSMADEGAILVSDEGAFHAKAPKGIAKNSVGAGDSLIGGFLSNYTYTSNIIEAFKWGVACGSATAFSNDLCKKQDVEKLINEIEIFRLK